MGYAAKKDLNHNLISGAFRRMGWDVIDTSGSRGALLDLIVSRPKRQVSLFVEVKNGPKYKLTQSEIDFIRLHPEQSYVVWDVDQVYELSKSI